MAAHLAPPSLGFSRQEHWSGLPFPSPMHESERWKWVAQLCPTLSDPMDCSLPGSSIHGIFQARVLEWGCHCLLRCAIQVLIVCSVRQSCPTLCNPMNCNPSLFCPWNFPGKNTGVGSQFLLRGSSQSRDQTCISCISCFGRQILYHCASWEAQLLLIQNDSHHHLWFHPFPPWMQFLPWPYQTTLSSLNMFIASIRPCYLVWNVSCTLVVAKNTIHPSTLFSLCPHTTLLFWFHTKYNHHSFFYA